MASTEVEVNQFMNVPLTSWDTLDEPVWDTVSRDMWSIYSKLKHMFLPFNEQHIYRDVCKNWDLWGPFLFFTYIAFSLNNCGDDCVGVHQSNFSSIFFLLWLSTLMMCVNYNLVLHKPGQVQLSEQSTPTEQVTATSSSMFRSLSLFQILCFFGYSFAIPSAGIFALQVIELFSSTPHIILKTVITVGFGFVYPCFSILTLFSKGIDSDKYLLVVYPIFFVFGVFSLHMFTFA